MNRFERLSSIAAAAGVAVGLLVANGIHDWLQDKHAASGVLALSDFLCVVGSAVLLRFVAEQALYSWRPLRRLVLGRQHVEGTWLDVVEYRDGSQTFGIVRFEPEGNSLRYGGENYTAEGKPIGDFDTDTIVVRWPILRFTYRAFDVVETRAEGARDGAAFLNGFGELRFSERDGRPTTYSGRCLDATQGVHSVKGWRIESEPDLVRLDSPEGRTCMIREAAGANAIMPPGSDLHPPG